MISNKHFNRIVSIFISIAIIFSLILVVLSKFSTSKTYFEQPNYVTSIFNDDNVIEINIEIDETAWQEMLDTATSEEYTASNITINGKSYNNVGIRPKGNSSLSQIATDNTTDRYSFKIKFDEYVEGQTLDGLSKLVLNNNISDATYMKEYLSYKLLNFLDVPTPECAYAHITVNGEEWGLYLAVEPIEEEFIARNYGSTNGNLYKPESDSIAMGNKDNQNDMKDKTDFNPKQIYQSQDSSNNTTSSSTKNSSNQMKTPPNMNNVNTSGEMQLPPNINNEYNSNQLQIPSDINNQLPSKMPNGMGEGMMGGGMRGNSNGADLVWNGDDISNYSAIFDNAIFKTTNSDDYTKILDMIEHLDSMEDIESYLDVDEVLRYFACNTFLVNLDSYVSNMNHNYYLYENNGVVSILPWDYNLSFAGFQATSASNAINFPIDSPVSNSLEDNPLIANLLEVNEYKELYHQYLNDIVENFINNGTYETLISKTNLLISDYIKNDATAFYTFDEYEEAIKNLLNFGYDRATSISAQLDGTQPSTSAGNIETSVNLNAMGQQGGKNNKDDINKMTNKPNNIDLTDNSNTNNTNNFTKLPNDISQNTNNSKPASMEPPNKDNNMKDFQNNNLAMGPNNNFSNNTNTSLIITFSSIVLLITATLKVSLLKKRKYIS